MLIVADSELASVLPSDARGIDTPHFAFPFTFDANGRSIVVQQDTVEDVASCAANVVSFPLGFREDVPSFGVPDPTFKTTPLNTTQIDAGIAKWEPRARVSSSAQAASPATPWDQLVTVNIEIGD